MTKSAIKSSHIEIMIWVPARTLFRLMFQATFIKEVCSDSILPEKTALIIELTNTLNRICIRQHDLCSFSFDLVCHG